MARIIDNKQKVLFCKQKSVCLKLNFLLDNFFSIQFFFWDPEHWLGFEPKSNKIVSTPPSPIPNHFPILNLHWLGIGSNWQ